MTNFLAHAFSFSENVPVSEKLMMGLEVTIIGVLIVFSVLFLIMLIIYLFQLFFGEKKESSKKISPVREELPKNSSAPAPAASAVNQGELVAAIAAATAMAQEELLVVLAAAVAAQEGCDPASSRYRIRSFRRIL